MEKIRIQKYISECGLMSRRAAEKEIAAGHFSVNGINAGLGDKIDPVCDVVYYNGKIISKIKSCCTYIALNKPTGYVTTMSDEKNRKNISDLIEDIGIRLYPVGRLDMYSSGLLLCTNDGELANKITHPSHNISKKYRAVITSHLDDNMIEELKSPFEIDGYMLKPFEINFIGYSICGKANSTIIEFVLHEGRNREIRKICAHHGYKLAELRRESIGEINLDSLPVGKWRYLTESEIEYLKNI